MPLTKRQTITLHSVLFVPYTSTVYRLQDVDNLLALAISVGNHDQASQVQIQARLVALESDPEVLDDLAGSLDQWYDLFGDSTQMDGGGVGATTGVSFDLKEERRMMRERILAIVPFSREYMACELSKSQSGRLNVAVIR